MSARRSGPTGLQLRPAFLDFWTPWEPLLSSLAHLKLGFTTSQLGPADQLLCLIIASYVLTIPYTQSFVDHCYIRPTLPPRAIEGVREIHPFQLPS